MNSNKKTARIAGLWYLLVAIFGSFNTMFVTPKLYVSGDAAATVNNILTSERLFRLGIMSNLICTICFLFLANALYKLFKSVDKDLVRLMVIFIIASVPLAYLEMLKFAPILLLSGAAYLSAFEPAQLQALAMVFLDLFEQGFFISYIFFGLWMFPLGLLVFKSGSGFIPKTLGVLLMVGCFGYLFNFLSSAGYLSAIFLHLNYKAITSLWMTIAIIAEILCILWLLITGPKDQQPASIEAS
ncbi:MAG: DUF4386 domain-containing protein [Planctomycetota bacterium]